MSKNTKKIDHTTPSSRLDAQRKKTSRPRAPLPKQIGGAHEDKTKRSWRQRKHKGRPEGS